MKPWPPVKDCVNESDGEKHNLLIIHGPTGKREFFVWCKKCHALGPSGGTHDKAVIAWNSQVVAQTKGDQE